MKRHRNAQTGEFVTEEYALAHPDVTVSETVLTDDEREAERGRLKALLAASEGQPGYAAREKEIRRQLDRLGG